MSNIPDPMSHLHFAVLPHWKLFAAYAIFLGSYLVFAIGKFPGTRIDRPGAAIVGAVLMVAFGIVTPENALRAIDFKTIVLLFAMMLIVGELYLAGFFEWATRLVSSHLRPSQLLPAVIFICGVLSAFFVNDIVCLAVVPFALAAARRMRLKPLPYVLAVASASNIGSVATITGNPQNMLIATYSGIGYRTFFFRLGPVAAVGLFLDWLVLRLIFGRAYRSAAAPETIEAPPTGRSQLTRPMVIVALVLAGFLAGSPPALVAALGAAAMLITHPRDPALIYRQIDWGVLVFFVGLFVIVGGAESAGLTGVLLDITHRINLQNAGIFTGVVAGISNLVSNVPAVMLLKDLVPKFSNPHLGWLILAMASTLAGNFTITGSVANIIVVERAKTDIEVSFADYFRAGLPITVVTLLFGLAWLALL